MRGALRGRAAAGVVFGSPGKSAGPPPPATTRMFHTQAKSQSLLLGFQPPNRYNGCYVERQSDHEDLQSKRSSKECPNHQTAKDDSCCVADKLSQVLTPLGGQTRHSHPKIKFITPRPLGNGYLSNGPTNCPPPGSRFNLSRRRMSRRPWGFTRWACSVRRGEGILRGELSGGAAAACGPCGPSSPQPGRPLSVSLRPDTHTRPHIPSPSAFLLAIFAQPKGQTQYSRIQDDSRCEQSKASLQDVISSPEGARDLEISRRSAPRNDTGLNAVCINIPGFPHPR